MTVKLFGLEFADEAERDLALLDLKRHLDRINQAENQAMSGWDASGLSPIFGHGGFHRPAPTVEAGLNQALSDLSSLEPPTIGTHMTDDEDWNDSDEFVLIDKGELDALPWGAVIVDRAGAEWRRASFYPYEYDAALYWTDARKPGGPMWTSDTVPLPARLLYATGIYAPSPT